MYAFGLPCSRYNSYRIFIGLYLLCFLVLSASYQGCLVSFITVPFMEEPINTIAGVAKNILPVGIHGSLSKNGFNLSAAGDPSMEILVKKYRYHAIPLEEAFKQTSDGRLILLESRERLKFTINRHYRSRQALKNCSRRRVSGEVRLI
jgi:hypothetical protein